MTHTFEPEAERCSNCRQTRRSAAAFTRCFKRPPAGTVVYLPTGARVQPWIVLDETEDSFGMVATKTTKRYTTKDDFGWPVYHKAGERGLYMPRGDE